MNTPNSSTSNRLVVSQPMYFPWFGLLQQVNLCDSFVFYDDVQFSKGSFFNRVQIKTEAGIRWLTVPLLHRKLGQLINEVKIDNSQNWKHNHRELIKNSYKNAPFGLDALNIIDEIFSYKYDTISEISCASIDILIKYFETIAAGKLLLKSSTMGISGSSSARLIDICKAVQATTYLTGHGARNYLDHAAFENNNVSVEYIEYFLGPYPQLFNDFTPYVSSLDLIANCGKEGLKFIRGKPVYWRDFLAQK